MVHISDLSWDEKECEKIIKDFKKGENVKVKILDINPDKERISLGIKHLNNDPVQDFIEANPINSKVTGKIVYIDEKGLKVELDSEKQIFGFIKKTNLSNDKKHSLNAGAVHTILPKQRHYFESKTGVIIEEISSTHFVNDSKKMSDSAIVKAFSIEAKLPSASITFMAFTLFNCLLPIFIAGTFKTGASIIPLELLPIIILHSFNRLRKSNLSKLLKILSLSLNFESIILWIP